MAERFPSVASFGEYRDKVLRFLNVENEDILSSMVRALTFDETGYKGSEMYVVKPVGRIDHEKQYIYLEHGKCLYTTLLVVHLSALAEGSFGDIKQDMQFRRYVSRGTSNVLAESILLVEIPYKSKKNEAASSRIFIR